MTPRPFHTATSTYAFAEEGISAPPLHVDTPAESTASSITNSSFDKRKSKIPSNGSSDICFSPAKTCNDHKRKTDERFTGFPCRTYEGTSHSARPVSNFELAEESSEQKKTSDTDSSSPRQHSNKKQKLLEEDDDEFAADMDPATTEGQLALYPSLTGEQAKVAARREYSRRNAAGTRKRNKNMVAVLREQVSCLSRRIDDLSASNAVLKIQHDVFRTQNCELRASRSTEEQRPRRVSSLSSSISNNNNTVSQLLEALQNQNRRQQDISISHLMSGIAAGHHDDASNLLPMLQCGLLGGNTQLLSARLQNSVAPPPLPVQQAMQNQHLSHTLRVLGAQQPHSRQFGQQPLSQDSDLQQVINNMSAATFFSMLSQSSGNR
jgi:hypothetical protein